MPRPRKARSASRATIHWSGPAAVAKPIRSQPLQPADGETVYLRVVYARIVRPPVDEASVVCQATITAWPWSCGIYLGHCPSWHISDRYERFGLKAAGSCLLFPCLHKVLR
jgi:hypothetical protein